MSYLTNIGENWHSGFKMHSQVRAFLQPTRANVAKYQFNDPIIFFSCQRVV